METLGIKRPEDLPFPVPEDLANAITGLLAAMERDDLFIGDYMDDVQGASRLLPDDEDMWVYDYYLRGGWHKDVCE